MPELTKSDIIENVLKTLIAISGRKTSYKHAVMLVDGLIKQLGTRYDFLKHVQIDDTLYTEDGDMISVMSDLNVVEPSEMGRAINDIITTLNRNLGDNAGFFFIKEFQSRLGDDYVSSIRDFGVDLSLLQLESEVFNLEKTLAQRRK